MAQFVFRAKDQDSGVPLECVPVELKVHSEIHDLSEEWSGKSDPRERRKLQNRLNQRASRRRKSGKDQAKASDQSPKDLGGADSQHSHQHTLTNLSSVRDDSDSSKAALLSAQHDLNSTPQLTLTRKGLDLYGNLYEFCTPNSYSKGTGPSMQSWCRDIERSLGELGLDNQIELPSTLTCRPPHFKPTSQETKERSSDAVIFEEKFLRKVDREPPSSMYRMSADHLLSLMYYNVFRALVRNVQSLGLDMDLMHGDDYPSPWASNDAAAIYALSVLVPPQLRPTPTQRSSPHHPCFDLPPDPALRDNGIMNSHRLPHGRLCLTLAGRETWFENDRLRRNGLIIWGESDRIENWEATEGFASCYPWLVVGAFALQASTNSWRAARGEAPIAFA